MNIKINQYFGPNKKQLFVYRHVQKDGNKGDNFFAISSILLENRFTL
jgi:hypothetical protein